MIDKKQVKDFQNELNCTAYEAYKLLLEIERNDILRVGLGVNSQNSNSFIEAIALALGSSQYGFETSLNENISIIADNVESLGSLIEKLNEKYKF